MSGVLLWTPTYGRAKAGRPARTYIQQLSEDTGCIPEDLPETMNDREKWRERVRDIRAGGTTWWWWLVYKWRVNSSNSTTTLSESNMLATILWEPCFWCARWIHTLWIDVWKYLQCNPNIRELSGPENKYLISGFSYIRVWSILFR